MSNARVLNSNLDVRKFNAREYTNLNCLYGNQLVFIGLDVVGKYGGQFDEDLSVAFRPLRQAIRN